MSLPSEDHVYQDTKFRRHISVNGWDITTSVLEKQTSAILEFYFRFWSRPFRRNRRVFLHQSTEFCRNRSTRCESMTSYPFLKMAATIAKYYFRFRICWCHCFQKIKVYQETKFCRQNSNLRLRYNYFRFWSWPFLVIDVSFCIRLPNCV